MTHNLNSTVFVYRNRETGAIKALYTEGARAMTGRDDYEHVASLEPRMWAVVKANGQVSKLRGAPGRQRRNAATITTGNSATFGERPRLRRLHDWRVDILPHLGLRPPLAREGVGFLRCYA